MEKHLEWFCSIANFRTKLPYIEFNSNKHYQHSIANIKCNLYQARLKEYQDSRQHAEPHHFKIGHLVFCANTKPNNLDSKISAAKRVISETKARDTFSLANVDTGTTLIRSAKFLKHGPCKHIGNDIDVDSSARTDESDGSSATLSKVPSPLVMLLRKPPRVDRLSPQDQEG